MEGYYGVVQAGGLVMPLNVRLSLQEFTSILNHAEARFLFFEDDFASLAEQLRAACPAIERFIGLDTPAYEELLATGHDEPLDILAVDEDATAELFYTSGSTGTPKGVMLTHRHLFLHALSCGAARTTPDNVALHTIPLFHANGWGQPQLASMLGHKQVMVRRFDPPRVLARRERHRANGMASCPPWPTRCSSSPVRAVDTPSLRVIMLGGAAPPRPHPRMEQALPLPHLRRLRAHRDRPRATIARPKAVEYSSDEDRFRRLAMAGWPVPGFEVCVVDLHSTTVPRDCSHLGEIVMRGDSIMVGYFPRARHRRRDV